MVNISKSLMLAALVAAPCIALPILVETNNFESTLVVREPMPTERPMSTDANILTQSPTPSSNSPKLQSANTPSDGSNAVKPITTRSKKRRSATGVKPGNDQARTKDLPSISIPATADETYHLSVERYMDKAYTQATSPTINHGSTTTREGNFPAMHISQTSEESYMSSSERYMATSDRNPPTQW